MYLNEELKCSFNFENQLPWAFKYTLCHVCHICAVIQCHTENFIINQESII